MNLRSMNAGVLGSGATIVARSAWVGSSHAQAASAGSGAGCGTVAGRLTGTEANAATRLIAAAAMNTTTRPWWNGPEMSEGNLTRLRAGLVRNETLASYASAIGVPEMLMLGKGEEEIRRIKAEAAETNLLATFLGRR